MFITHQFTQKSLDIYLIKYIGAVSILITIHFITQYTIYIINKLY